MEFPGNSDKDKMPRNKRPEKKVEKVVTSEVIPRKKSMGDKFKGVFVGGELKTAVRYIGIEVLVPALRNMIVDATTKGIERVIYGDNSPRRQAPPGTRVQYNAPVNRYGTSYGQRTGPLDQGRPQRHSNPRYEVMELLFGSREEADVVLEMMTNIIEEYEMVSVADLHELAGLPSSHTDNKWGWASLRGTAVKQVREGFLIDFPPVEPI